MSFGSAMSKPFGALLCCFATQASCIAAPNIQVPQCPAEFSGKLVEVRPAQEGWQGLAATRFVLERATIVAGPPDVYARAELRGDERRIDKSTLRTTYSGLDGHTEKWLVCGYGLGSDLEQLRRLPDAVRSCVIESSHRGRENWKAIALTCN